MIRSGFAKFLQVIGGDRPIGNITKDHCRAYKESMTKDGLVAATVNKHLHCLSHCLTWAHGQGFLPEESKNPVAGLRIAKSIVRAQKVKVVPFSDAELSVIFSSSEFTRWKARNPERYYGVLALLLTAARREEVYQLDMADVKREAGSGIWYFTFTGEGSAPLSWTPAKAHNGPGGVSWEYRDGSFQPSTSVKRWRCSMHRG